MAKKVQDLPNQFGVALTYEDESVEVREFAWFEAAASMVLEVEALQREGEAIVSVEMFNLQTGLIIAIDRGVGGVPFPTMFPRKGGDYVTKWQGSGVDESFSFHRVS
jgi:hypothetical protein